MPPTSPVRTTIWYPEMVEFIDEHKQGEKRSVLIKWLLWVGATAVLDAGVEEPRRPGGLQVDLDDPQVKERLQQQAAYMRSKIDKG